VQQSSPDGAETHRIACAAWGWFTAWTSYQRLFSPKASEALLL